MTLPEPWITAINLSFEKPGSVWAKRLPSKTPTTTKNNVNTNRTRRQSPVSKPKDKVLNLKHPVISTQLEEYQRRASFMSSGSAASSPLVPSPGLAAAVTSSLTSAEAAAAAAAELNPNALPFVPSFPNDGPTLGTPSLSHHNAAAMMAKNSKGKGKDVHRTQVGYVYTSSTAGLSLENNKAVDVIRRSSQTSTPSSTYYTTSYDMDMEIYAGWGEGEQSYEYEFEYDQEYGYEYDFYPSQPHLIHQ
ncbi:hypothetical protein BDN72DRAFT_838740 [Pluteus cervinus]|uniref:Uncharacterized protein n=1 Tax=Pluteus cervinus TaxID=181527 RepID=A0ACD3AYV0_9AGAR|nr:hypothetical protein BDN72DRAFT_838740 [Pluteus cervinus]